MADPKALQALTAVYGNGALGAPNHILIAQDEPVSHAAIHLTLPRVVGVDFEKYDPATFDHNKCRAALPDYQREFTNGVECMIRWKEVVDPQTGETKSVCNSRVVKFANGDLFLQVGRQYFELSTKPHTEMNHKTGQEQLMDHLFINANGYYYHVGDIHHTWKAKISTTDLSAYGPRMAAVKTKIVAQKVESKIQKYDERQD